MRITKQIALVIATFALMHALQTAHAQPTPPAADNPPLNRPKIALVLSGGGARGAAHVGVIKVLEELRIPIDIVTGTSIGALVGAAYASGTPLRDLEELVRKTDWNDVFTDSSPREDRSFLRKEEDQVRLLKLEMGIKDYSLRLPPGAITGQKLDRLFSRITRFAPGTVDFDRLPIPFRAVTTDAETGKMYVFKDGRLADAMRASMSVPGAVAPFEFNNRIFLDGGLTRNLPVDIAREMGADIVIAVNIGSGLLKRQELLSVLGVSLQMINILTEQNVRASIESLKSTDVLITPALDKVSATDFNRGTDAMKIGEAAARGLLTKLAALSLSEDAYTRYRGGLLTARGRPVIEGETIDLVQVVGLERANANEVKRTLDIKSGEPVNFKKLDAGISRIFGTGYFERVNYSLLDDNNLQVLRINAREKQWGPNYLRVGLSLAADSVGEGRFNLLIRSQQTQFNQAGAEWRNDVQIGRDRRFASRFFQPFGADSFVNIAPGVEVVRRRVDLLFDGKRIAQYDVSSDTYGVELGADISRNAIARVGLVGGRDRARLGIGPPALFDNVSFKQGGVRLRAIYDNQDDLNFPREGRLLSIDYLTNMTGLGASENYRRLEANYSDHISFGPHTIGFAARYGRAYNNELSVFDQFSLGGFLQLSGYRPNELLGNRVTFGRLSYSQRLPLTQSLLGSRVFAGASIEAGKISEPFQPTDEARTRTSLGIYLGADTALGPLYLGYGRARDRGSIFYFFLGQP
ncbi:MAG: patatin-like phospholipase family protein [Rhodocyclaceae bacterium]|nr:patatin-like phospholipase family protein [Rhodocyclaceae bacterium]MCA3032659.1 patatin-like phospholipase family protein [Rhodocyclaceae bacterium]MCA3037748.1 patatin-like phospholipase family protein [Rhodocyclaceae bacterium]MCA3046656.1 patatin-like phospholipase family protein [Rhodocyclaceae bacterium]MCA3049470.1 patatin-like phospholipase family protein [Rhodocyclaceae bacterium]